MAEPGARAGLNVLRPVNVVRAAARLARERATPFYLFDREAARASLRRWRAAATKDAAAAGLEVDLFYPWKCNRHPALVALARDEGWGTEVTAPEDLATALSRLGGESGARVIFQGPAKPPAALGAALAAGAWLVADSVEDARAIVDRARALGVAPRYLLRFRASSAEPSQRGFGLTSPNLIAFVAWAARARAAVPEGLAFHLGTGLAAPAPFVAAVREAGALARRLAGLGVAVRILDAGGGFPARREARRDARGRVRGRAATPEAFLRAIRAETRRSLPNLTGRRLFLEPGRAVASDAFHLVTRVVRTTERRVYVDASRMAHAFFVPRGRHPFRPIPRRAGRGPLEVRGPLPSNLDLYSERAAIGRPRAGDLLLIESVGAYNLITANAWSGGVPEVWEAPS
jgi:ornithine decarboxylase